MGRPEADTLEDLEFLDENGVGAVEAAKRLGFPTTSALDMWLRNRGRLDLWHSLKRRDPAGTHLSGSDRKKQQMTTTPAPATHPLTALLDEAEASPVAKHRRKAERIRALIAELRTDLDGDRERRQAEAEARAEVEKLEEALAEAKAKLREAKGQPAPAAASTGRPQPKGEFPCRLEGCDKVYDTPQGRSLHERMKCERRTVAEAS